MITEQELASAVVTVEQSIRDNFEARQRDKHDSARLKELSLGMIIDKTKLQILHYTQGVTGRIPEEELHRGATALKKYIQKLQEPVATDLFHKSEDAKELEREKLITRTKLFALNFVAGEENKIL